MKIVLEKREQRSKYLSFIVPLASFVISLILGGIVLALNNANPFIVYAKMAKYAFGSKLGFGNTMVTAIPLMFIALGVGLAFRLKFWNIGGEGQYVWGAIGATYVMLFLQNIIPSSFLLPVALLAGFITGGIWSGISAVLKAYYNVDETLTTLMNNYVAIGIASFLYYDKWKAPLANIGTQRFPSYTYMTRLWGKVHSGLIIVIILAIVLYFILYKTRWGFELNMIGKNSQASRVQGVNVEKNIIIAIVLSGAICGLGGAVHISAVSHQLTKGVDSGYGYTGIIIAWMSQLNPFATLIVSVLLAGLFAGGDILQFLPTPLPSAMSEVLQGLILIPLLAGFVFIDYKLKFIKKKEA